MKCYSQGGQGWTALPSSILGLVRPVGRDELLGCWQYFSGYMDCRRGLDQPIISQSWPPTAQLCPTNSLTFPGGFLFFFFCWLSQGRGLDLRVGKTLNNLHSKRGSRKKKRKTWRGQASCFLQTFDSFAAVHCPFAPVATGLLCSSSCWFSGLLCLSWQL